MVRNATWTKTMLGVCVCVCVCVIGWYVRAWGLQGGLELGGLSVFRAYPFLSDSLILFFLLCVCVYVRVSLIFLLLLCVCGCFTHQILLSPPDDPRLQSGKRPLFIKVCVCVVCVVCGVRCPYACVSVYVCVLCMCCVCVCVCTVCLCVYLCVWLSRSMLVVYV